MSNKPEMSLDTAQRRAKDYLNSPRSVNPQSLLQLVFITKALPKERVADLIGVQSNQVSKLSQAGGNAISRKGAKALAEAILEIR